MAQFVQQQEILLRPIKREIDVFGDGKDKTLLKNSKNSDFYFHAKRFIDVSVTSLAIFFLLPVMAVIAIAIKFTSPGPVLFIQERVGARRRGPIKLISPFNTLKS